MASLMVIQKDDSLKSFDEIQPLNKSNVKEIHSSVCGGLLGSKKAVDYFNS